MDGEDADDDEEERDDEIEAEEDEDDDETPRDRRNARRDRRAARCERRFTRRSNRLERRNRIRARRGLDPLPPVPECDVRAPLPPAPEVCVPTMRRCGGDLPEECCDRSATCELVGDGAGAIRLCVLGAFLSSPCLSCPHLVSCRCCALCQSAPACPASLLLGASTSCCHAR